MVDVFDMSVLKSPTETRSILSDSSMFARLKLESSSVLRASRKGRIESEVARSRKDGSIRKTCSASL